MTVETTSSKIIYLGTGDTSTYSFSAAPDGFNVYAQTDLVVTVFTIATGVTTKLTLSTHYTVALTAVTSSTQYTGTITLLGGYANLAATYKLIIQRTIAETQDISFVDGEETPASVQNEGLDRGVMRIQQVEEKISRAVLADVSQTAGFVIPLLSAGFLYTDGTNVSWVPQITSTTTTFNGNVKQGADSAKAAVPAAGDVFFATDTKRIYQCRVAGSWDYSQSINALTVVGAATVGTTFNVTGATSLAALTATSADCGASCEANAYTLGGAAVNTALGLVTANANNIVKGIRLGAWDASSYSTGTVYQAPADGFVGVSLTAGSGYGNLQVLSDAANPPTTERARINADADYGTTYNSCYIPVRKGDYFKIVKTVTSGAQTATVQYIPSGD